MFETISRDEAKQILMGGHDVILVEVLGPDEFHRFHLPRAINVPFDDQFDERIRQAVADRSAPVLVYCRDAECHLSRQAAQRMDELGYAAVYDYEAGKEDWKAAGLQIEQPGRD